jgi:hypothetical protein
VPIDGDTRYRSPIGSMWKIAIQRSFRSRSIAYGLQPWVGYICQAIVQTAQHQAHRHTHCNELQLVDRTVWYGSLPTSSTNRSKSAGEDRINIFAKGINRDQKTEIGQVPALFAQERSQKRQTTQSGHVRHARRSREA